MRVSDRASFGPPFNHSSVQQEVMDVIKLNPHLRLVSSRTFRSNYDVSCKRGEDQLSQTPVLNYCNSTILYCPLPTVHLLHVYDILLLFSCFRYWLAVANICVCHHGCCVQNCTLTKHLMHSRLYRYLNGASALSRWVQHFYFLCFYGNQ